MPAHDIEEEDWRKDYRPLFNRRQDTRGITEQRSRRKNGRFCRELFDDYDQMGTAHYSPEISSGPKTR
ncbi:MAG: hypothetical protein ACLVGL_12360 [Waltera sp.]